MVDRHFNEVDLQLMLDKAIGYHEDPEEGRWAIETKWNGKDWLVIVYQAVSPTIARHLKWIMPWASPELPPP